MKQLTLRAVFTGMLLGGALSLCNIYSGLKVGFTTNMSVTAALLGYGLFQAGHATVGTRSLSLQESVTNQTAASAAASIAGSGLVAAIPALTMMTGYASDFSTLVVWVLSVSVIGVIVAVGVRRQMIELQGLTFPHGVATATLLRQMYGSGRDASVRIRALLAGLVGAASIKAAIEVLRIPLGWIPGTHPMTTRAVTLKNLGFAVDPSVLMVGVGALVGMRASASMLLGAVLGWLGLAPWVIDAGWVDVTTFDPDTMWFSPLTQWLLWPGVALMVSAALTGFALSAPRLLRGMGSRVRAAGLASGIDVPPTWFWGSIVVAGAVSCWLQNELFDIAYGAACLAVAISFILALVAGRVTGETGIAPIGAMGKVTQLIFSVVAPGNPAANLMAANVTGGSASQCGDMLHDLKTGHLLGSWPRHQALAQFCGILSGTVAGSAVYMILVPNPAAQLLTPEWPAPAVAQWKAVAEVFAEGVSHLPPGAVEAAIVAGMVGVALSLAERFMPARGRRWLPNAASMGLALVLPAYSSISMMIGASLAWLVARRDAGLSDRFTVIVASGVVAGESLVGVVFSMISMLSG